MYCSFSVKFDALNCRTKSGNCFAESRSSLILPIVLPVVLVMFLAIIIILIGKDSFFWSQIQMYVVFGLTLRPIMQKKCTFIRYFLQMHQIERNRFYWWTTKERDMWRQYTNILSTNFTRYKQDTQLLQRNVKSGLNEPSRASHHCKTVVYNDKLTKYWFLWSFRVHQCSIICRSPFFGELRAPETYRSLPLGPTSINQSFPSPRRPTPKSWICLHVSFNASMRDSLNISVTCLVWYNTLLIAGWWVLPFCHNTATWRIRRTNRQTLHCVHVRRAAKVVDTLACVQWWCGGGGGDAWGRHSAWQRHNVDRRPTHQYWQPTTKPASSTSRPLTPSFRLKVIVRTYMHTDSQSGTTALPGPLKFIDWVKVLQVCQ